MRNQTILRNLLGILTLTGGLFLAACGDSPAAPTSVTTTIPTTTSAATAKGPSTTVVATTAAPTSAPGTTGATTTSAAGTNTPAQSQNTSGKAVELLSNIPNSAENLKSIIFNNYVTFRQLYNIPDNATFQTLSSDKDAFARFNAGVRLMYPAMISGGNYLATMRTTVGFDILQSDFDAESGELPNLVSMAQGKYDFVAIDKAWTSAGATKRTAATTSAYTIDKADLKVDLQRIFIGPEALVTVPDKNLLIYGKPPARVTNVANEMPNKTPITSHPAVKGLLDVFGDPLSLYMGTNLISPGALSLVAISPGAAKDALQATINARQPVPPPVMGGMAFYQDASGAKYYLVANYYADPNSAKAAQPIMEDQLKNGKSLRSNAPYSDYWTVSSSEVKGNVLVVKLDWKGQVGLSQFVLTRDFPLFTS